MKKNLWIILFAAVLIGDMVGIQLSNEELQYFFKPLIIPALVGYFYSHTKTLLTGIVKWIFAALFFSWAGDILLMFVDKNQDFFLAGLISFLVAHILYSLSFYKVIRNENVRIRWWILMLVTVSYLLLMIWLSPYLGEMKWPVRIYGFVICTMFLLAAHLSFIKFRSAGTLVRYGALLFLISDFLIATNKFYQSFDLIGFSIMLTYGLAQLLIVMGASYYLRSVKIKT